MSGALDTPMARTRSAASVRLGWSPSPAMVLPILLCLMVVALCVFEPRFMGQANLVNVARNTAYLVIVGVGQMLVMILGGLDLSVGAVVALSSVTTALVMTRSAEWFPDYAAFAPLMGAAAGLGVSALVGLANGLCVALLNASAFMVTLGMFSIVGGVAYYVTAGIPIYGMPAAFTSGFGRGTLFGLPYSVLIAIALILIIWAALRRTCFGRHVYAIGGSPSAARASGVATKRHVVAVYVICSTLAGLAGVLITARVGAGQANLGSEFMLQSIGAAVIAGVSLRGGVGRPEMLLASALFLTLFANAMNLVRIDSKIQTIVFGLVLLAAVFIDRRKNAGSVRDE